METVANKTQNGAAKTAVTTAKDDAALKAKKAESAKAWKEKKTAEKAKLQKVCADILAKHGDKLTAEEKAALNAVANPTSNRGGSTSGLFEKIFGDSPKVGQSVTLMDIFQKTFKSKADIDRQVKIWAEKGIVVEYTANADTIKSTYTIKALAK